MMQPLSSQHSVGSRAPFLIGAQAGLILLALPCAVSPSFESMFEPYDRCLPIVTELVLNPIYPLFGGFTVLGMLVHAFVKRGSLSRPGLLAWAAVLLSVCLLLLYVFGIIAPMRPL